MNSLAPYLAVLVLGVVCVVANHDSRNVGLDIEMDITGDSSFDHRPRPPGPRPGPHPGPRPGPGPRPRRPAFFVGTYRSVPTRDWQINMWQIYNASGLPTDFVNEAIKINVTDNRNGTFQYTEFVGNATLFTVTFQLNKPVSVNGTNSSSDEQYLFTASRSKLSILSNSSDVGASRADIQFCHGNGVDVVYRVLDQKITGARHFRRVRRGPGADMPAPEVTIMTSQDADQDEPNQDEPNQDDINQPDTDMSVPTDETDNEVDGSPAE